MDLFHSPVLFIYSYIMNVCASLCSPGVEFSLLHNLTAALSDDDTHYVIRFANSLFLQEGVTFNPEFLHLMRKYFRADVETVDFSESAAVAEQINNWVENHTESELEGEGGRKGNIIQNLNLLNTFPTLSCTDLHLYPCARLH